MPETVPFLVVRYHNGNRVPNSMTLVYPDDAKTGMHQEIRYAFDYFGKITESVGYYPAPTRQRGMAPAEPDPLRYSENKGNAVSTRTVTVSDLQAKIKEAGVKDIFNDTRDFAFDVDRPDARGGPVGYPRLSYAPAPKPPDWAMLSGLYVERAVEPIKPKAPDYAGMYYELCTSPKWAPFIERQMELFALENKGDRGAKHRALIDQMDVGDIPHIAKEFGVSRRVAVVFYGGIEQFVTDYLGKGTSPVASAPGFRWDKKPLNDEVRNEINKAMASLLKIEDYLDRLGIPSDANTRPTQMSFGPVLFLKTVGMEPFLSYRQKYEREFLEQTIRPRLEDPQKYGGNPDPAEKQEMLKEFLDVLEFLKTQSESVELRPVPAAKPKGHSRI